MSRVSTGGLATSAIVGLGIGVLCSFALFAPAGAGSSRPVHDVSEPRQTPPILVGVGPRAEPVADPATAPSVMWQAVAEFSSDFQERRVLEWARRLRAVLPPADPDGLAGADQVRSLTAMLAQDEHSVTGAELLLALAARRLDVGEIMSRYADVASPRGRDALAGALSFALAGKPEEFFRYSDRLGNEDAQLELFVRLKGMVADYQVVLQLVSKESSRWLRSGLLEGGGTLASLEPSQSARVLALLRSRFEKDGDALLLLGVAKRVLMARAPGKKYGLVLRDFVDALLSSSPNRRAAIDDALAKDEALRRFFRALR